MAHKTEAADNEHPAAMHDRAFRDALAREVERVPSLEADFGSSAVLVWLSWGGDSRTGYWVGSGLDHNYQPAHHGRRAHILIDYMSTNPDETTHSDQVLSIDLPPQLVRNAEMHAAMIVAAVRVHGEQNNLTSR